MNQQVVTILVLGLLLIAVFSPFAGLAGLMLVLFAMALGWVSLSLVRAFVKGEPQD